MPTYERQSTRHLHTGSKQWRDIRAHVLSIEPLCRDCSAAGHSTVATEVDHQDNNTANDTLANLCPLCKPCHSHRTARREAGGLFKGCDADGLPLDPRPPWNREKSLEGSS